MFDAALTIDPLIPLPFIWGLGGLALILALTGFLLKARGALLRLIALAALTIVLLNPSLSNEKREPLDDVVVVIADRSQSQSVGARTKATDEGLEALRTRLTLPGIDLRVIEAGSGADGDGTLLFGPVEEALKDTPPERIGAVILLTDGQVHDVPQLKEQMGHDAPVHALITGVKGEADRKLTITSAPRFGIVGQRVTFTARIDDLGPRPEGAPLEASAGLTIRVDGGEPTRFPITIGEDREIEFTVAHGGANILEIEADPGPAELTLQNNRAVIVTNGIRDKLRVLLVSGEPHTGERTWRNLLNADPAVELVHFTILRPPEKQDMTPNDELALIGFPVHELFSERLYDFDLIIFDRYKRREVIPTVYFSYIADYIERGGALLVAAGPDFNSADSIARTALVTLLPLQPGARVYEEGFRPRISDEGQRHPVTAGLPGANRPGVQADPLWGRWFRLIDTEQLSGRALMTGPDGRPLLVLDKAGRGRVAQLMSDHAWLWARGHDGGGPQAELLRRLGHWLMKEPDLEEEVLSGEVKGSVMTVTRRTMATAAAPVTITKPGGGTETLDLKESVPGRFSASLEIDEVGLYRLSDGTLSTIVAVGPLNPKEVADMRASDEPLAEVTKASGGGIHWIGRADGAGPLPAIRMLRDDRKAAGRGWIGIRRNDQYVVASVERIALILAPLAMVLLILAFLAAWRRESQ